MNLKNQAELIQEDIEEEAMTAVVEDECTVGTKTGGKLPQIRHVLLNILVPKIAVIVIKVIKMKKIAILILKQKHEVDCNRGR